MASSRMRSGLSTGNATAKEYHNKSLFADLAYGVAALRYPRMCDSARASSRCNFDVITGKMRPFALEQHGKHRSPRNDIDEC
jgi:hypothetical protein